MKRILSNVLFIALIVIALLGVFANEHALVLAQDTVPAATPTVAPVVINFEPAPSSSVVNFSAALPYLAVIALLGALLVFVVVRHDKIATVAANGIPAPAWPSVRAGLIQGANDIGAYVRETPSPLDDAVYTPTRSEFDDLIARIDTLEQAKATPPVIVQTGDGASVVPPGTGGTS